MRAPARPPILKWDPDRFHDIVSRVSEGTVGGRYLHWDEVRHRAPPEGLSVQEWWAGLKWARMAGTKGVPLFDLEGKSFGYNLADPIPRLLHEIDLAAGGRVTLPEPVVNPETRNRYLFQSLVEEAVTSSQLEGAVTTREVAKEMILQGHSPRDRGERMILNNYQTMERVLEIKDKPLTAALIFEIHRMVTDQALDNPSAAGRLRTADEPCVVGDNYGEILYSPPPATDLPERLDRMIAFANDRESEPFTHPVVRSIILHFWLAFDHPFVDGNGRTARALFYWSMLRHRYWLFEFLSISRRLLKAPTQYYRAFLHSETDENDLTYFLIHQLEVIHGAIGELNTYLDDRSRRVRALEDQLQGVIDLNHRQRALIGHAIRHPGFRYTIASHQKSHGVVYQTARADLLDLAHRGLLRRKKQGKTLYFSPVPQLDAKLMAPASDAP